MAKTSGTCRIAVRSLGGIFFVLWFVFAIGCKTQNEVECPPPNSTASLPPLPPGMPDAVRENAPPLPESINLEASHIPNSPNPLVQTSFENPVPRELPQELPPEPLSLPREMTLEEVFEQTLQIHPLLRVQKEEVQAAHARLITAGMRINPELVVNADRELSGDQAYSLNSRVMFTLETAGKRRIRQAAASADIARAQCELKSETERILTEAADAAWEVLYLQELLVLEGKLHDIAAKTAELERSRADVTYAEKIVADTDAAELELERLEAKSTLETAGYRLSRAIGFDCPQFLRMRGEIQFRPLKEIPTDELICRIERSRPQICGAQQAAAQKQYLHALECAKAKPDIGLGPRFREGFEDGTDQMGMRFTSDLPIFNRNQGGILESAAEMRMQCERVREARIATLTDAVSAYKELLELQGRLQYYRQEVIPLVERTEATIHNAFAAGQLKAEQMSDLQRNSVKLRLKELELRYRYNLLLTRLELFLGEPIVAPNEAEVNF
jgi:cobalt-zinc-cadmium efflux system outer membrane protein